MAGSGSLAREWTPNQTKLIRWLARPESLREPRTHAELAKDLGVGERTLYRWKELPGLTSAVAELAREHLEDDLPEVYHALTKKAKRGSFQHIKLVLELAGHCSGRKEVPGKVSGAVPIRLIEVVDGEY
jgi:hypothetical protein